MRITFLLLTINLLTIHAVSYTQSSKVSINLKDVAVKEILSSIEDQSDYKFLYSDDFIENKFVSVHVENTTVSEVLDLVLKETGNSFREIENNLIIVAPFVNKNNKQQITIRGKVTDMEGIPLPGVNVVEKGTTNGAVTDLNGSYTISVGSPDAVLSFSFLGFITEEIELGDKTTIDVILIEDIKTLEEVVVIGYGTSRKKDLTGAIGSVRGDILEKKQVTQLSQALQGTIPGLMVTRTGGMADESATIRVRGITTIGNSNPLVIIDGIPGNMDDVNPADVESISVLKDAASAAIYGSRAASGVILITTKRAKSGIVLDYNVEYGIEQPTRIPEYENAVRYMEMYNEMKWNDNGNVPGNEYNTYTQDLIENYPSLHAQNPDEYPDTDWQGLFLNDFAPRQSHVLSMNAGSQNFSTKASLAYDKINAMYDSRSFERITGRINNDLEINNYLSASVDVNFVRTIDKRPIVDYTIYRFQFAPIYAAVWSDGRYAEGKTGANGYPNLKGDTGFNDVYGNKLGGRISLDFTPIKGLKISGILAPNFNYDKHKYFQKTVPYTALEDPNLVLGTIGQSTLLEEQRNENYSITNQLLANYEKDLGKHHLKAMAGFENYFFFAEELGASRDQYELDAFPYLDLGPLEYRDNNGNAYELAYRSWFGQLRYDYQNKYLLKVIGRYDGSSRFHEDHRWGFFPSLSMAWVISEEGFFNDNSTVSFLKLRTSWGKLGNERIGVYPYQSTVSFDNALFYQGSDITSTQVSYVSKYAIPDISWETTESYDIGVDANFFNNKLRITADYYKKTTKDMLLAIEIPNYMGFDNPEQNTGDMYTTGWEFDVGYNNSIGDLRYSVSVNLSDFRSIMGNLGGTEFLGSKVKFKDSEFNEWYGYKADGLFQTQDDVDNSAVLNTSVAPGDIKYVDISGPDGEPDGIISSEYDRVLLGGSLPRLLYGGNVRLDYKSFDFSMIFQGVGKQNSYINTWMAQPFSGDWKEAQHILDGNYWSQYNTPEQNQNVKYPRLSSVGLVSGSTNNYETSDYWLFNGAYFRLKNITLGYTIPTNISESMRIKNARVYGSISDLFSLDKFPDGWDPEGSTYFIKKSFVFGVSINF